MTDNFDKALSEQYEADKRFIEHINKALVESDLFDGVMGDFSRLRDLFDDTLKTHMASNYAMPIADRSKLTRDELLRRGLKPKHKKAVLERDKYRCTSCSSHKNLCVDHKTPVSRGGDNHESNLQALCRSCNGRKGNKTMAEWLGVSQ